MGKINVGITPKCDITYHVINNLENERYGSIIFFR